MDNNGSENLLNIPFEPSTIENIDQAVYNFVNEDLDISTRTNKGFKKVPVLWQGSERAWYTKKDPKTNDTLNFPIITVARTGLSKDTSKKGFMYGNVPPDANGASIQIAKRIMQEKTAEFSNAFAKQKTGQSTQNRRREKTKTVYEFIGVPQIVHINPVYEITLTSLYTQQMNEMLQPFMVRTGNINYKVIENNLHRYELFMGADFNISDNSANLSEEQRKLEAKITFNVIGYLFGQYVNEEKPEFIVRESIVEYKFPKETIIFDL
jgi:hypothetical protein